MGVQGIELIISPRSREEGGVGKGGVDDYELIVSLPTQGPCAVLLSGKLGLSWIGLPWKGISILGFCFSPASNFVDMYPDGIGRLDESSVY